MKDRLMLAFLKSRTELSPETVFAEWALFCARHDVEPGTEADFCARLKETHTHMQRARCSRSGGAYTHVGKP